MVPAMVGWSLWRERNSRVFENSSHLSKCIGWPNICFFFELDDVRIVTMMVGAGC